MTAGVDISAYTVAPITKAIADLFVLQKHYSRRVPVFWAAFGLIDANGTVQGVCVFGQPSPPVSKHSFANRDFRLWELSRLVVQTIAPNAASFLIARALAALPAPCAVVSYADTEQAHCGIVYQATNWLYTGATVSHDHAYLVDGKRLHPMTLRDRGITNPKEWARVNGIETVKPMPKHRYYFLVGNKRAKRAMRAQLKYPVLPEYPKCSQRRYDTGPELEVVHAP